MMGMGLVLSVAMVASGLADAQRNDSPFDQVAEAPPAGEGFAPILVPAAAGAPTLMPPVSGQADARPTTAPPTAGLTTLAASTQGPAAGEGPAPSATLVPVWVPNRLIIPAIELDAPVVPSALNEVATWGQTYQQWVAPDTRASGWHTTSAPLGVAGNTVLNGHHNIRGEVFGHLADLKSGDLIWAYAGARAFVYRIVLITTLPERWQTMEVRLANAQWIQPSQDERLTLVTCWPYASNTHRLVVVAMPVDLAAMEGYEIVPRVTAQAEGN